MSSLFQDPRAILETRRKTFQSYSPESSASFCLKDPASAGSIFFVWIRIIPRKFLKWINSRVQVFDLQEHI